MGFCRSWANAKPFDLAPSDHALATVLAGAAGEVVQPGSVALRARPPSGGRQPRTAAQRPPAGRRLKLDVHVSSRASPSRWRCAVPTATEQRRNMAGWDANKAPSACLAVGALTWGFSPRGRDRFRTCGLCRVKRVRPPHTALRHHALHHIVAGHRHCQVKARSCYAWLREGGVLTDC